MDTLEERIEKLELGLEAERKSVARRVGLWGGLIALIISIFAGGIGLYDRLYLTKIQNHQRNVELAQSISTKLKQHAKEASELEAEGNLEKLYAYSRIANVDKATLLNKLNELGDDVISELSSGDLIIFSHTYLERGFAAKALSIAELARKKAPQENSLLAETTRYIARTLMFPGDVQDLSRGREMMREALGNVENWNNPNRDGVVSGIYQDWIWIEAHIGNCEHAQKLFTEHNVSIANSLHTEGVQKIVNNFKNNLKMNTACNVLFE